MLCYDRIKELRIAAGMSQDDLAKACGYKDRSMVTKIEKGLVDLSQSKIERLAEVLFTTPAYLMGWTDRNSVTEEDQHRLEALHQNPRLGLLFDHSSKMSKEDVDVMIRFAEGILKSRDGDA